MKNAFLVFALFMLPYMKRRTILCRSPSSLQPFLSRHATLYLLLTRQKRLRRNQTKKNSTNNNLGLVVKLPVQDQRCGTNSLLDTNV